MEKIIERYIPKLIEKKIAKKFSDLSNDVFTRQLEECLKYLYLVSSYSELRGKFIPVSKEIDEVWHELILETEFYEQLCKNLPGGRFIHHAGLPFDDYEGQEDPKAFVDEVISWFAYYTKSFGLMTEEQSRYWYFVQAAKEALGVNIDELNLLVVKN